jgi:hypothetical protein
MSTRTLHPLSRILSTRPVGPMRSPARALGWFSIGLGLAELAMPRRLARLVGAPNAPTLTRIFGLREIGTGIGILTSKDPSPWLWGRVAGDALDVATVGAGLVTRGRPLRTLTSVAMLLGIAWVDLKVAEKAPPARKLEKRSSRDYTGRSGFPRSAAEMRGVALKPSTPMGRPQGPAAPMTGSPVQPLMQAGEPVGSSLP